MISKTGTAGRPFFGGLAKTGFERNFQQMFPFGVAGDGHGIVQSERDQLRKIGKIAMWHITAFVPAKEAQGSFVWC